MEPAGEEAVGTPLEEDAGGMEPVDEEEETSEQRQKLPAVLISSATNKHKVD